MKNNLVILAAGASSRMKRSQATSALSRDEVMHTLCSLSSRALQNLRMRHVNSLGRAVEHPEVYARLAA